MEQFGATVGRQRTSAQGVELIQKRCDGLFSLVTNARIDRQVNGPRRVAVIQETGSLEEQAQPDQKVWTRLIRPGQDGPVPVERAEIQCSRMQPAYPLCDALPAHLVLASRSLLGYA